MGLQQTSLLITSLLLCIETASGLSAQRSCPASYCGNLQISYPFRLKGDKPTCGDRRYELTCDGNRTIIDINYGKYYVKSISYSKDDGYIRITDVRLASDGCALPSNTLSLDTIENDERFSIQNGIDGLILYEASFLNCTREIQGWYPPNSHVPCLSGSNAFVYVIPSTAPTCRVVTTVPANYRGNDLDEDFFEYLQNGFSLKWVNPSCDGIPFMVQHSYSVTNF